MICPMCKNNYVLAGEMKKIVDAAELLVDAADLAPVFSLEAVAAAGNMLTQRVIRYREVVERIDEEEESHAVQ